jgi:hypothetical protein
MLYVNGSFYMRPPFKLLLSTFTIVDYPITTYSGICSDYPDFRLSGSKLSHDSDKTNLKSKTSKREYEESVVPRCAGCRQCDTPPRPPAWQPPPRAAAAQSPPAGCAAPRSPSPPAAPLPAATCHNTIHSRDTTLFWILRGKM